MPGDAPESGGGRASGPEASSDVFISYASQDKALADTVCEALERAGVVCWIAPRDVTPGEFYADTIVGAINTTQVVVLVLTENAVGSPHVLREVERASAKRHPVVTFRIEAATLTAGLEYFLSASHWLDATAPGVDAALPKLVKAVQRLLAPAAAVEPRYHADTAKPAAELFPQPPVGRPASQWLNRPIVAIVAVIVAYLVVDKLWFSKHAANERPIAAVTPAAIPSAPAISEKSVAVMPFVDMSEKKDQEYFSDGLSEELIDMLTKVPELRVPARTSSFYFKGKQATIADIARALTVTHVLEGSVRKSGEHLRITAQLVRADNGYHLWSQTYDRQLDDIFKVQDEIAGAVVRALKVSLLEREAPSATLTTSSEAYELYLQAGSLIGRGTSDDALTAYADLQQAVRLDPKFALAWARLAWLLSSDFVDWSRIFKPSDSTSQSSDSDRRPSRANSDIDPYRNWGWSWAQARAAAHAAAERAIKLGPDLGESHRAMGQVLAYVDWDWATGDAEFRKARELEPGKVGITLSAADLAMVLGRVSEGLQLAKRATAQDPLGGGWRSIAYGQYISGDLDEAQKSYRKQIELYPTATAVHAHYALVLLARGEPQAALSEFERDSAPQYRDVYRPFALDALGRRSEADSAIALAEQKWGDGMAWNIACFYAARNDSDRAFYWLERAYRQHDGGMAELKVYPLLRNLQRDPRYKALLHRVNLPE